MYFKCLKSNEKKHLLDIYSPKSVNNSDKTLS